MQAKYLVIDDEITKNPRYRQNFVNKLSSIDLPAHFVGNCTDALNIIKHDDEIIFCFLDCRMPENLEGSFNYSPGNGINAGINLIPKISALGKKISIIVFSAYVDKRKIKEITERYSKEFSLDIAVIGCFNKRDPLSEYLKVLIPVLKNNKKALSWSTNDIKKVENFLNDAQANCDLFDLNLLNIEKNNFSTNIDTELKQFDYEELDLETQLIVKEKATEIKRLLRRSAQDICDIGKFLTEVKQTLQHGQFYPWITLELQWSSTSAVRFMKVYEKFKSFNLNDLNITPSALYELSNSAVPNEAIMETIKVASSGENITLEAARAIKQEYQKQEKSVNVDDSSDGIQTNSYTKSNSSDEKNIIQVEQTSVKQKIVKIISPQRIWHLGKRQQHTIICQDPNSSKFIEQLPSNISLSLSFPSTKNWKWLCDRYKSSMDFYSEYTDLDFLPLLQSIQNVIEITTSENDNVVVCFAPHIKVLSLINSLGCNAIIAEPDRDKCLKLVEVGEEFN